MALHRRASPEHPSPAAPGAPIGTQGGERSAPPIVPTLYCWCLHTPADGVDKDAHLRSVPSFRPASQQSLARVSSVSDEHAPSLTLDIAWNERAREIWAESAPTAWTRPRSKAASAAHHPSPSQNPEGKSPDPRRTEWFQRVSKPAKPVLSFLLRRLGQQSFV